MKYLDEFGDPGLARRLIDQIHAVTTGPWAIMEVCGGQTHSIIRHGIDQMLPPEIEMIHGPGCPVCVTPLEIIDKALEKNSEKRYQTGQEFAEAIAWRSISTSPRIPSSRSTAS